MKIYITIILISLSLMLKAQVVIGLDDDPDPVNDKVILSFTSERMGLILPIINTSVETASINNVVKVPGALFVSRIDGQVKVFMHVSPVNSSGLLGITSGMPIANLPIENTSPESANSTGVVLGASSTAATGVLVLEDNEKTLILPMIGTVDNPPHLTIKDPYIGTIGFAETKNMIFPDTKPAKKLLWVFDGNGEWHLWGAGVELPPGSITIDQAYLDSL